MDVAKLVLLGGPTGIGKTTVLRILERRLVDAAVLDADDVWRVSGEISVNKNRAIAISNAVSVMRGYFEAGCKTGILSWVFARSALFRPVIDGLEDLVNEIDQVYLMSSMHELDHRLDARGDKDHEYAMSRLKLINALHYPKIDTTHMTPDEVATAIITHIGSEKVAAS